MPLFAVPLIGPMQHQALQTYLTAAYPGRPMCGPAGPLKGLPARRRRACNPVQPGVGDAECSPCIQRLREVIDNPTFQERLSVDLTGQTSHVMTSTASSTSSSLKRLAGLLARTRVVACASAVSVKSLVLLHGKSHCERLNLGSRIRSGDQYSRSARRRHRSTWRAGRSGRWRCRLGRGTSAPACDH
jgi:hypothetical protein